MEVRMTGRKEGSHGGGNEVGRGGDIITLTSPSKVQPQGTDCA